MGCWVRGGWDEMCGYQNILPEFVWTAHIFLLTVSLSFQNNPALIQLQRTPSHPCRAPENHCCQVSRFYSQRVGCEFHSSAQQIIFWARQAGNLCVKTRENSQTIGLVLQLISILHIKSHQYQHKLSHLMQPQSHQYHQTHRVPTPTSA